MYVLRLPVFFYARQSSSSSGSVTICQALEKELESVASKQDKGDTATVVVGDEKRDGETSLIFATYDRNQSGALEFEELQECLTDLGALVSSRLVLNTWYCAEGRAQDA